MTHADAPIAGPPPWEGLRDRLLARADALEADGADCSALRAEIEEWWQDQQRWNGEMSSLLGLHHEINNALVGVRGNAQLLWIGPAGKSPGVKERLETVIREADRIQQAGARLRELKSLVAGRTSRAA